MQRIMFLTGLTLLLGYARVEAADNSTPAPVQPTPKADEKPTPKPGPVKTGSVKAVTVQPVGVKSKDKAQSGKPVATGMPVKPGVASPPHAPSSGAGGSATPQSLVPITTQPQTTSATQPLLSSARTLPVLVGWHDEMDDATSWQQAAASNPVDVFAPHPSLLTLRLPHVPEKYPYEYQWGGLQRDITVDLGRYPVAVAYVSRLQEKSYAQISVTAHDFTGHEVHTWITPATTAPGLLVLDIGREWGVADTRRFTFKLLVGGALYGASCDYDWMRFVNREEIPFLQSHLDWQKVELRP